MPNSSYISLILVPNTNTNTCMYVYYFASTIYNIFHIQMIYILYMKLYTLHQYVKDVNDR